MWGLHVDCSSSALKHINTMLQICSGAYSSKVKCVHTSVHGHIVDFSGFI